MKRTRTKRVRVTECRTCPAVLCVACLADSRLFAGVHFRSANDCGAKLGQLVAGKVFDRIQPAKGAKQAAVASEKGAAGGRRMSA